MKRYIYILLLLLIAALAVSCAASPGAAAPNYGDEDYLTSPDGGAMNDAPSASPNEIFEFEWNDKYQGYFVYEKDGNPYSYVVIPETYNNKPVVGIGKLAFNSYSKVQKILISNNISVIETQAFNYCNYLEVVEFKDNSQLETVKEHAFYNCKSLVSIYIPSNVKMIGSRAFSTCPELKEIKVDENNEYYSNIGSAIYSKDEKLLLLVAPATEEKEFTVPEGVIAIGDGAFRDCIYIESISIPSTLKSLGSNVIGASVKEINYSGSVEEWKAIRKETKWDEKSLEYVVNCTDGTVTKK